MEYQKPFILLTPFSILLSGGPFTPFLFGSKPLDPAENMKDIFISLVPLNKYNWLCGHLDQHVALHLQFVNNYLRFSPASCALQLKIILRFKVKHKHLAIRLTSAFVHDCIYPIMHIAFDSMCGRDDLHNGFRWPLTCGNHFENSTAQSDISQTNSCGSYIRYF